MCSNYRLKDLEYKLVIMIQLNKEVLSKHKNRLAPVENVQLGIQSR